MFPARLSRTLFNEIVVEPFVSSMERLGCGLSNLYAFYRIRMISSAPIHITIIGWYVKL